MGFFLNEGADLLFHYLILLRAKGLGLEDIVKVLVRGVRTEMALNVLAYNIKHMISLIGVRRLMEAIPG